MNALLILLSPIVYIIVFYGVYILVMGIYRAHLNNKLKWYHYGLLGIWVIIGYLVDMIANFTIATLVFTELPHEYLVTTRLKRYQSADYGYRSKVARFVCESLLDPFDPNGDHC